MQKSPTNLEIEEYKRNFIGSLYREAPGNSAVVLQGQQELYSIIITKVAAVASEGIGRMAASNSVARAGGAGSVASFKVVGSRIFDFPVESSVTFYCNKYCDPIEKGSSKGNQVGTYYIPTDYLILSDVIAPVAKDDPLDLARMKIAILPNRNIATEGLRIIDNLQQLFSESTIRNLPPIIPFALEDGSLLIELVTPHIRLGFNLRHDKSESSWYLVTDESQGNIRAYGDIIDGDIRQPLKWTLPLLG